MRDFIYDLRRTFTGKFTLITIAVIVIISALLGYGLTTGVGGSSGSSASLHTISSYTYSNNTYNVSIYAYNQFGQPAPTLTLYLQYNNTYANITTDSGGFAHYTIHSNDTSLRLNYSLTELSSSTASKSSLFMTSKYLGISNAQVYLKPVTKSGTTNSYDLLLYYSPVYLNQNFSKIYLYYNVVNTSGGFTSSETSIQNMTYYSQVTVNQVGVQILDINVGNLTSGHAVYASVFSANNSTADTIAAAAYSPHVTVSSLGTATFAFQVYGAIFGLLIPLLSSLSAYFYFGKDKASGVLESVITRPVTKGRIILSRYVANVGSLVLAFAIGVAVFDLFLYRGLGANLTPYYAVSLIWSYFVEIAAFTGIIYIASQYMRSQGAILGTAIGIFLVFALFWSGVIEPLLLIYGFHAVAGTNLYQQYEVYMDAINPASYGALTLLFITKHNTLGNTIDLAKFGVTQVSIAAIGLIWFIVPIAIAFITGRKRD